MKYRKMSHWNRHAYIWKHILVFGCILALCWLHLGFWRHVQVGRFWLHLGLMLASLSLERALGPAKRGKGRLKQFSMPWLCLKGFGFTSRNIFSGDYTGHLPGDRRATFFELLGWYLTGLQKQRSTRLVVWITWKHFAAQLTRRSCSTKFIRKW